MSTSDVTVRKSTRSRRWIPVAAGLAALLLLLAVLIYQARTPVAGGLGLGAEPGVELFVGDRLAGVGGADVRWSEIFGWSGDRPLGIVLPPGARDVPNVGNPSASDSPEWIREATAERLGGKGATIVQISAGNPPQFSYSGRHKYEKKELLLRRSDGTLDQVFCLDVEVTGLFGRRYRAIVPIRPRAPQGESAQYFSTDTGPWEPKGGRIGRRFDNGYTRMVVSWGFAAAEPPPEVAAEIFEKGLWRPSGERGR